MSGGVGFRRGWTSRELRDFAIGILLISPWLIGFLSFLAYPLVSSLYYSFTDYDILREPLFTGLENYHRLLSGDANIGKVVGNTLYYVVFGVPVRLVVAFLLASLLNQKLRLRSFFRTIFYIPAVVPVVAAAMVWLWIFNVQYGVINTFLAGLGLQAIPFLSSESMVKPSLIAIDAWASGTVMLIFLAALQDVPRPLYDAATVDGANRWQRYWNVTIPMVTPAILFSLLTSLIFAFQQFTTAWILTQGGPNRASEFYALYLYRQAFEYLRMGYASALAWGLFVVVVIISILVYRSSARWVYYGGE